MGQAGLRPRKPSSLHCQHTSTPPPALRSRTWRMKNACRTGAACCATCCCWLVCRFHIFTPLSHPPAGRAAQQLYHSLMLRSHMVQRAELTPQHASIACPTPPLGCPASPANTMLPSPLQALHITGLSAVMAALGMAWPLLCTSQHSTCMGSQERQQREQTRNATCMRWAAEQALHPTLLPSHAPKPPVQAVNPTPHLARPRSGHQQVAGGAKLE